MPTPQEILAKVKADNAAKGIVADTEVAASDGRIFTEFSSARRATRMFTQKGARISFVDHKFITDKPELIAYLREEIAAGMRDIKEVGTVTSADLDPMKALEKQFFAKFQAEQAKRKAELAEGSRDMGSTSTAPSKAASSKTVAN